MFQNTSGIAPSPTENGSHPWVMGESAAPTKAQLMRYLLRNQASVLAKEIIRNFDSYKATEILTDETGEIVAVAFTHSYETSETVGVTFVRMHTWDIATS